jgi:hypothetical protein
MNDTLHCPVCNRQLQPDFKFCPYCATPSPYYRETGAGGPSVGSVGMAAAAQLPTASATLPEPIVATPLVNIAPWQGTPSESISQQGTPAPDLSSSTVLEEKPTPAVPPEQPEVQPVQSGVQLIDFASLFDNSGGPAVPPTPASDIEPELRPDPEPQQEAAAISQEAPEEAPELANQNGLPMSATYERPSPSTGPLPELEEMPSVAEQPSSLPEPESQLVTQGEPEPSRSMIYQSYSPSTSEPGTSEPAVTPPSATFAPVTSATERSSPGTPEYEKMAQQAMEEQLKSALPNPTASPPSDASVLSLTDSPTSTSPFGYSSERPASPSFPPVPPVQSAPVPMPIGERPKPGTPEYEEMARRAMEEQERMRQSGNDTTQASQSANYSQQTSPLTYQPPQAQAPASPAAPPVQTPNPSYSERPKPGTPEYEEMARRAMEERQRQQSKP